MNRLIAAIFVLLAAATCAQARTYKEMFGHAPASGPGLNILIETINFRQGSIEIKKAGAQLTVPKGFYYLNSMDTAKVLVQLWGNPPSASSGTLGMLFPAKYAPDDPKSWGSVITYSQDGHVSDEDAEATDYDALLESMKEAMAQANVERAKQGYEPQELIGWASPPHYDKQRHALHWARDLLFGNDPNGPHTLNYAVRILGREGVLELNFVAGMSQLAEIKAAIPATLDMVKFSTGNSYTDFQSGDKVAAYGLAGLIAAGAGAKIAAKVGLLAGGLIFLKKFAFIFVIIFAAIGRFFFSLFKRNKDPSA